MQSAAAVPTGPGWVRLSDKTYMNNLEPIKDRALVYKGKHYYDREWHDIAVKLIAFDQKSNEEVRLHMKLEAQPNIIKMYEAGVTSQPFQYIYIAMELCSQTLKDFIEEHKDIPLDFQQYFNFAKQIVSAVAFIHESNILHRDLKLENILVLPSEDHVRVADLGLSKQILEGHSIATASFRGIGSDGYRAPELLHEKPMASFRSDSFALGIILAMLFSNGRHPYGTDLTRWRTNIADNKGKDLTHIVPFKEPYTHKRVLLVDLIEKCLEHNPQRRPTPSEMLRHRFFAISPTEPPPADTHEASLAAPEIPTISEGNLDEKDPWEEFLDVKKKKQTKLENDLKVAIRHGDSNHSRILGELNDLCKTDDLDTILPLAEYELVHKKDESCIERLHRLISNGGSRSAVDIRQKGYSLQQQGQYVQALMLYIIAHVMHKVEGKFTPDLELKWIHDRATDISSATIPLLKSGTVVSRSVARNYGVRHIFKLMDELRATDDATPTVKALHEIGCLVNLTSCTNRTGEHEKCIEYGEEGVSTMKQQFGDSAVCYKDYGKMLNNLGNAYDNIGKYSKAKECYNEAIRVKSQDSGYPNDEERQRDIEVTRENLENTLGKMVQNPLEAYGK